MKKIYVFLLFVFLLGFVGLDKASGQCEYCQYPSRCNFVNYTIECNGQTFPIQAVICYNCDNNRAVYAQVLEISYPAEFEWYYLNNPQCSDAVWDSLWTNIRRKSFELCGYVACPNTVTIYRTFPICGEFIYEGPPGHEFIRKRFHPDGCNLRCVVEYRVCYNFDAGTFEEEFTSLEYFGSCPRDAGFPGVIPPGTEPFRIGCAQLWSVRDCPR